MPGATYKSDASEEAQASVIGLSATAAADANGMLGLVTDIWQRTFGRSPIPANANFFDLGGDSLLATQLFIEIEAATGRDLPVEILFGAPTIASMARALEETDPLRISSLVQMKVVYGAANLFIIPGASGSIVDLRPLVANINFPISVYAIKPKGLMAEAPLETIEAMAEHGLDAIKTVDKTGPYLIVGYSVGGLVAIEMAVRLVAAGERVQMLALLGTYPIERTWPLGCHFSVLAEAFVNRLRQIKHDQSDEHGSFVLGRFGGFSKYLWRALGFGAHDPSVAPDDVRQAVYQLYVASERAVRRYRPSYYDGKVTFFQPFEHHLEPGDPRKVWRHFAREIEVHNVPGDHIDMIGREAQALGTRLTFCLEAAIAQTSRRA